MSNEVESTAWIHGDVTSPDTIRTAAHAEAMPMAANSCNRDEILHACNALGAGVRDRTAPARAARADVARARG